MAQTKPQHEDRQRTSNWRRRTVRLQPWLDEEINRLVEEGHYPNRSEAIREALTAMVDRTPDSTITDHGGEYE